MATDAPTKLGYAEMMARMGMGSAWSRCFVAGVGVAALLYCVGFPKEGFREDGSIRPCSLLNVSKQTGGLQLRVLVDFPVSK